MPERTRSPKQPSRQPAFKTPIHYRLLIAAGLVGVISVAILLGVFVYYYTYFGRLVDQKLAQGPFANSSLLYAAPEMVTLGDELTPVELIGMLRRRGYTEKRTNRMGWYNLRPDAVEIFPGPDSFFSREPAVIKFQDGVISHIISLQDNTERTAYYLEPELVSNLFDSSRQKRRLVPFSDLPDVLVKAVLSAEDKRFFQHAGFDPLRIIRAAVTDLIEGRPAQGASTLSMQLARYFWLDLKKTWQRKAAEVIITIHLERRLTKEQIFEYYANQVDLGFHRSFQVHGFAEGARVFFGKDIREITLPEAALMVGVMPGPSLYNPYRNPERALRRRNVVLKRMLEDGHITQEQYERAVKAPLGLAQTPAEAQDASYFVDVVSDQLQRQFEDLDFRHGGYRVYTTLDMNLQREALEAVRIGMEEVDKRLEGRRRRNPSLPKPQAALVALDAQTGEVKALVGGRNYGESQLNRALAKRQPGSVFKPFVYAAALNTALEEGARPITTVTQVMDEPTTFWFDDKPYEPSNFKDEFHGLVTVRTALTRSLNVPTVKVAEMVGYDKVVELARAAGMNLKIQPTPAVALGAYEVTPVEIAAAYTVFANHGNYVAPAFLKRVVDPGGNVIYRQAVSTRPVLDQRVNYIMVDLLRGVILRGTGAGVRARGFVLPAAGKTGTSHDGWFAGFTSKLICVVWVGFDDNRELNLEGASSALPIWTEFMKRAHQYRQYRGVREFDPPEGIIRVDVDPASGELATPLCPEISSEPFIAGTEPSRLCHLHAGGKMRTQIAGWDLPESADAATGGEAGRLEGPARAGAGPSVAPRKPASARIDGPARVEPPAQPPKRKGLFERLRDIFR